MQKELDWLRRNKKFLSLSAIANEVGLSVRTIHGTVNEQSDGHGTPFKIPEKYHANLKKLIKKIQSH